MHQIAYVDRIPGAEMTIMTSQNAAEAMIVDRHTSCTSGRRESLVRTAWATRRTGSGLWDPGRPP